MKVFRRSRHLRPQGHRLGERALEVGRQLSSCCSWARYEVSRSSYCLVLQPARSGTARAAMSYGTWRGDEDGHKWAWANPRAGAGPESVRYRRAKGGSLPVPTGACRSASGAGEHEMEAERAP